MLHAEIADLKTQLEEKDKDRDAVILEAAKDRNSIFDQLREVQRKADENKVLLLVEHAREKEEMEHRLAEAQTEAQNLSQTMQVRCHGMSKFR